MERGMVIGMGRGTDGQLGIPSKNEVNLPRPINALRNIRVSIIGCGMAHTGIVTDTGALLMFGKGKYGRLGYGNEGDLLGPTEVKIGVNSRVTALACGGFHTAVVTARGELFTFGRGDSGQLGLGTPEEEQRNNRLLPMCVSFNQKVTRVACGVDHTICCTAQGEMYGFGSNEQGQLGLGQDLQGTYSVPQRVSYQTYTNNISAYPSAVACGHQFSAMILDGSVFMWGQNEKGQCGVGGPSTCVWLPSRTAFSENVFITSISCGLDHTLAVTELGQVYTWGSCEYGQLGIASELLSISSRSSSPRNITTASPTNYLATPFLVKEALLHERVVTGCCGSYHSVVVTVDGKLFSWGLGDKGQLGKNVEGSGVAPYPYHVRLRNIGEGDETTRISVLAAGGRHTIAATYCKPLISVPPATLSADLERLYSSLSSSPLFFDVVIYVQNDTSTFDAHRIFLSRVPKLHSILNCEQGLAVQELRFPSVSRGCMALVLNYIYTNRVPKVKDDEVKKLAQEWGLHHLYSQLVEPTPKEEVFPMSIPRHLKKYVNNPEFSDIAFSFTMEDNTIIKIYAHKAILVLRCEFFLLEFAGNFKESVQPVISLPDTSPSTFLQLLHYLYQDEVSIQSESVELLALSNLYQLTRLKNLCEETIVEQIDVDNAVLLYEIAQQYEAPQLLSYCDYFIITQYNRVSQTNDFKMKFLASKQQNFSEKFENWNKQQTELPITTQNKCSMQ